MPTERRLRARELAHEDGVTAKVFTERTGYSSDQFQYWFGMGSKAGAPSTEQMTKICEVFDWSPAWILLGRGPKRVSELDEVIPLREGAILAIENNQMLKALMKYYGVSWPSDQ